MNPTRSGEIITFYSYKGGSGRSMALANIAWLLADPSRCADCGRILAIDWDLEAPGLHRFFQGLINPEANVESYPGVIDLFLDLDCRAKSLEPSIEPPSDASWARGFSLDSYVLPTVQPGLDIMKAGRFGSDYARNVTSFDWAGLYTRASWLFAWLTNQLTRNYSYILIDSRTGETDTSSICTSILPEKLVAVFTPNLQAIQGVLRQVERAVRFRRTMADERPIKILPLPSRIENARTALREKWRFETPGGYQPRFEELFRDLFDLKSCDLTAYFGELQIPQSPDYAYGEPIAVREEMSHDRFTLSGSYVSLMSRLLDDSEIWETPSPATTQAVERASSNAPPRSEHPPSATSSWSDAASLVEQLQTCLGALDWQAASAICDQMIERVWRTGELLPVRHADVVLGMLRTARRFEMARKLADVFIQAGETSNHVQRAYARALLESGSIAVGINVLERLLESGLTNIEALADTYGLLGSAHKRIFVNLSGAAPDRLRPALIRSLDNYTKAYGLSSSGSELFGIHVVALLLRARRDALEIAGFDDPYGMAKNILDRISSPSRKLTWEFPVGMQAALALSDFSAAFEWLDRFLESDLGSQPDAVGSTLDQLTNIWKLSDSAAPGDKILPALRGQLLRVGGANVDIFEDEAQPTTGKLGFLGDLGVAKASLPETVAWFQTGLLRARNVARIEDEKGQTIGTGFLISIPNYPPNSVLLAPSHVISNDGVMSGSLDPAYAVVNFTIVGFKTRPAAIIASSPVHELDYSLLRLQQQVSGVQPYLISTGLPPAGSGARVYMIGHPQGGDLRIALGDNRLLDYDHRVLHYRSAGGPGSSGSPIFNDRWQVVGMHHAGRADMPRLHGVGTYQASEGIRIKPILASLEQPTSGVEQSSESYPG
jgi:hypothetical protein